MAIWWTEDDIGKVARQVLAGDVGKSIVRQHINDILREEVTRSLGAELRAVAEQLGEEGKASLQRKLNSAYARQAERLTKRIAQLEMELEAASPLQQKRLEAFEDRLDEVSASLEGWLNEPTRSIQALVKDSLKGLRIEVEKTLEKSTAKTQAGADQIVRRADDMMQAQLYALVLSAVREHVKSLPFEEDRLSNRQFAAARGMSLRAVKRMRRAAIS